MREASILFLAISLVVLVLLLANFNSEPKKVSCAVKPGELPHPVQTIVSTEIVGFGPASALSPAKLAGPGESILLPAEGAHLIRLK